MERSARVVLAADHAGFPLKEAIKQYLVAQGIDVIDVGTFSEESVDYPAIIRKGCGAVLEHGCPGIIFGGSGNGEAIAANKVHGIRAALVYSDETARLAREHNNANILSLGGRLTAEEDAKRFVDIFLATPFEGGRHQRRIDDLEVLSN
jgi:ribose 5-phosphate isomerase B